ncbi:hypothetical protein PTSG_05442 [Salpingoeca rosetta]|uniref:C2 NT-type domain-containing protein n=1 Tax=Salpingoeca rosetta (strain ATCC 50818 / BSB-021) TaxID=946362 RepID=F2UAG0_SALR5|nr:uncharacterized protein PTSG_05442 [Salpingoeca rosetta]EGD73735.1 hypothetical protein PTSG_05442 [Salpingoeca rosetta]|eukprot:XP_004994016.1 hypothetical protein PTSG_05442 [Salpingoeca rosetta]
MMGMWGSSRAIKFEARVCIRALHALPYHNAVVFCRVKHKGTPYLTSRASARFNMVRWDETISFPVKTKVKKSGTVARDDVTITVFREAKGGRNSKQTAARRHPGPSQNQSHVVVLSSIRLLLPFAFPHAQLSHLVTTLPSTNDLFLPSLSSSPSLPVGDPSDDLSALFATTAATPLSQQEHAMNS